MGSRKALVGNFKGYHLVDCWFEALLFGNIVAKCTISGLYRIRRVCVLHLNLEPAADTYPQLRARESLLKKHGSSRRRLKKCTAWPVPSI